MSDPFGFVPDVARLVEWCAVCGFFMSTPVAMAKVLEWQKIVSKIGRRYIGSHLVDRMVNTIQHTQSCSMHQVMGPPRESEARTNRTGHQTYSVIVAANMESLYGIFLINLLRTGSVPFVKRREATTRLKLA